MRIIVTEEEIQKQEDIKENIARIKQIISENVSYTTTPCVLQKAINMGKAISDKDPQVQKDKEEIIDLVLRSEYGNHEQAEAELNRIKMKYKGKLNSYIAHVRGELCRD